MLGDSLTGAMNSTGDRTSLRARRQGERGVAITYPIQSASVSVVILLCICEHGRYLVEPQKHNALELWPALC